jgi:predicted dehydrogenase
MPWWKKIKRDPTETFRTASQYGGNMTPLRFAVLGCGFWSQYQIAAWRELEGVELVAVYNRTRAKAEKVARQFSVARVYDDAEALFATETLDFVDIITDVDTHATFTALAARAGVPVICQKPMAPTLAMAESMVQTCRAAGVPFMIHENFRWQTPLRKVKHLLEEGTLGKPFRARILFNSSFPVFDNQPFLRDLKQFILTDVGSHILDVARFLFGEARTLYCRTQRVNPTIQGEDVATVVMEMGDGVTVSCEMSYASRLEHERFPETYLLIECGGGSLELGPDCWIRLTTTEGTHAKRYPPPYYHWADPRYALIHASIVPCNADLLRALRTGTLPETSGEDNLQTVRLIYAAYDSAVADTVVLLDRQRNAAG